MIKKIVSSLLILVLTLSLSVFVLTYSAKQTFMNPEFYKDCFARNNAYSEIRQGMLDMMEKGLAGYADKDEIMEDAKVLITEGYIKKEMERNVDSFCGGLSGNTEAIQIYLEFSEIREKLEVPELPEKIDLTGGLIFNVSSLNNIGRGIKNYLVVSLLLSLAIIIGLFFLNDLKFFFRGIGGSFVISGLSFLPLMLFQKSMPAQMPGFMNALISEIFNYPKVIFVILLVIGIAMIIVSFLIKKKD